jgi:dTDP-4-amino-4,6-dideoxygalactose transaminase
MPCDLRAVLEIAGRHGLRVIEDAACAVGSEILWRGAWERLGKPHGDIACFSFHPRKAITTGEGGMVTSARAEWDGRLRGLRNHGVSIPASTRSAARQIVTESYEALGYNYRLSDLHAALGREQLKRLAGIVARRRALAARYLPLEPPWARSNWQSFCVRLPDSCDQRVVMQRLLDRGIASRRGILCAHREPACAEVPLRRPLPASERAQDRCMLLPLYPQLTEAQQRAVGEALRDACRVPSGRRAQSPRAHLAVS